MPQTPPVRTPPKPSMSQVLSRVEELLQQLKAEAEAEAPWFDRLVVFESEKGGCEY